MGNGGRRHQGFRVWFVGEQLDASSRANAAAQANGKARSKAADTAEIIALGTKGGELEKQAGKSVTARLRAARTEPGPAVRALFPEPLV